MFLCTVQNEPLAADPEVQQQDLLTRDQERLGPVNHCLYQWGHRVPRQGRVYELKQLTVDGAVVRVHFYPVGDVHASLLPQEVIDS